MRGEPGIGKTALARALADEALGVRAYEDVVNACGPRARTGHSATWLVAARRG